ncbi:MAG TPA: hypothetical protein VMX12_12600 [Acidimicrobiia bacterium]|nr:hypothetical protein [Acidimicrobiia bacterium]
MADDPAAQEPRDAPGDEPSALEARAAEVLHAAEEVAAATGRAMVTEAKDVRRRILQDATKRRTELVAELVRVRGLLDGALDALRVPMEPSEPGGAPAPGDGAATADPAATPAPVADDLFARLRSAEPNEATAPPAPRPQRAAADVVPEAAPEPVAPDAENEDPDDALRRRRDAILEPLVPGTVRAAKRVLQDEQNSLLDAIRRARGKYEPARLLPDHEHQREAWVAILTPPMDAAFLGGRAASGKTGRVTSAPARVVGNALSIVVTQLRDRLATTIESVVAEGPYESPNELQRALGSALGARYREWKGSELEAGVRDAACAAYARGGFEAAGVGTPLRWVPAVPGHCPDCDDNGLEPTIKGSSFPTGQSHPPAHPGCRCLVVPLDRVGKPTSTA